MFQAEPAKECSFLCTHQSNMSYTRVTNHAKLEARGAHYAAKLPKRARASVSPTIRFIRTCLSPVGALFLCRASLGLYQVNAQQLLEHVLVWRVGSI